MQFRNFAYHFRVMRTKIIEEIGDAEVVLSFVKIGWTSGYGVSRLTSYNWKGN